MEARHDITELLVLWREGDGNALDRLLPLVYDELRRIAHAYLAGERSDHTLRTTALVHEAYLRLIDTSRVQWRDRAHFLAAASGAMRRVLVDYARRYRAGKRGGGIAALSLDEGAIAVTKRIGFAQVALMKVLQRARYPEREAWLEQFKAIETRTDAELFIVEAKLLLRHDIDFKRPRRTDRRSTNR